MPNTVRGTLITPNPLVLSSHLPKHCASPLTRCVLRGQSPNLSLLDFFTFKMGKLQSLLSYLIKWLCGSGLNTQKALRIVASI